MRPNAVTDLKKFFLHPGLGWVHDNGLMFKTCVVETDAHSCGQKIISACAYQTH